MERSWFKQGPRELQNTTFTNAPFLAIPKEISAPLIEYFACQIKQWTSFGRSVFSLFCSLNHWPPFHRTLTLIGNMGWPK